MTCDSNIIVVGAGPGGHAAALEAAHLGCTVTLVEQGELGGTCLNWGCIPTKLFLGATAALPELLAQTRLKLLDPASWQDLPQAFSLPLLQERKRRLLQGSRQAMEKQLKDAGVRLLKGRARFLSPDTVQVKGETEEELAFDGLVLATGSHPAFFPGMMPDGKAVLSSYHLLDLETPPESLIIVGGGAIGLEFGDFLSRFGCRIELVEALPQVAPTEDPEVGAALARMLKRAGWKVHLGRKVASVKTTDQGASLSFEDGETLEAEKALIAVGRKANTSGMGLDVADVATDGRGAVVTDTRLRATDRICAVGDCNGRIQLAHAAAHQGRYAAHVLAGDATGAYAPAAVPACIYGSHEVLRSGPGIEELQAAGPVFASKAMLAANPIAQAYGATQGFVKALWQDGQVRTIMAVGHGVSSLSTAASLIVSQGWSKEQARDFVFAHPSLDEALAACLLAPQSAV